MSVCNLAEHKSLFSKRVAWPISLQWSSLLFELCFQSFRYGSNHTAKTFSAIEKSTTGAEVQTVFDFLIPSLIWPITPISTQSSSLPLFPSLSSSSSSQIISFDHFLRSQFFLATFCLSLSLPLSDSMTTATPSGYCTYSTLPPTVSKCLQLSFFFFCSTFLYSVFSPSNRDRDRERERGKKKNKKRKKKRQNWLGMNSQLMCNIAFLMIAWMGRRRISQNAPTDPLLPLLSFFVCFSFETRK